MDTDFNEATAYKLQADNAAIAVAQVTDEIDGDEYAYTEVSIPLPEMNTVELAEWIGTEKSRNSLHGEHTAGIGDCGTRRDDDGTQDGGDGSPRRGGMA
jgi:hypothetical protein